MFAFLDWLAQTDYAFWVTVSWGWPAALTVHAFGTATVVGLTFIIALRFLGLFRTIPFSSLKRLIPFIWIGVVAQVLSGFSLFLTKPTRYVTDGMFLWKLAFVVAGVALTLYFQRILNREAVAWDSAGAVSRRDLQLIAVTAVVWATVLILGRLTAYLGQLYLA